MWSEAAGWIAPIATMIAAVMTAANLGARVIVCANGEIRNVVVAGGGMGGAGEELRAVPRGDVRFSCDRLALTIGASTFVALDKLRDGSWPAKARAMTSGLSGCARSLGVFAEARHQPFQRTL